MVTGVQVWVEDAYLAWAEADVTEIDGKKSKIHRSKGYEVSSNSFCIYAKDPNAQLRCLDDMTKLAYLHEPALLYILSSRWELDRFKKYFDCD